MKNKRMLISAVCSFLLSTTALAKSMDPVSLSEIDKAKSLAAINTTGASVARTRSTQRSAADTAPNTVFLRVETHSFDKSESTDQRWADVTSYDYTTDELIVTVVNLDNDAVVSTKRFKNMQPPMSKSELARALSIVLDDPEERSIIDAEYKRITGEVLTSIDQLDYKAFTFFADSMPNVVNRASSSCGRQRCAQLMLYTHDRVVFEVSPIVNLSAGVVTQRIGY